MFFLIEDVPFAKDKHDTKKRLDLDHIPAEKMRDIVKIAENRKRFHGVMEQIAKKAKTAFTEPDLRDCLEYLDQTVDFTQKMKEIMSKCIIPEFEYICFASSMSSFKVQGSTTTPFLQFKEMKGSKLPWEASRQ